MNIVLLTYKKEMVAKTFLDVDYTSELEKNQIRRLIMSEEEFYKKKDHKVTIKKYGFINWSGYHMYNYPLFKLIVYILFSVIGIIIGLLLANKL